jgi:cytoskeleton protein RodZ
MVSQQKQRIDPATPSNASSPQGPETQAERIGDILRRERERRGDDLQRIADHLCIKTSLLQALENNDYDAFPADAYVIGFLRSYAIYLGFDGKDAIDRYRLEMAGRRRKPALAMPPAEVEGRAPSGLVIVGALIAGILIYAIWYGLSSSDRSAVSQPPPLPTAPAPETPPPHSDATTPDFVPPGETPPASTDTAATAPDATPETVAAPQAAPAPTPTPAPVAAATPPAPTPATSAHEIKKPAAGANGHLQIRALQPSWILIKDSDGATVVDRVMKAGETYTVPDQKGLTLTTGNGSGLALSLDGKEMPKLSTDSAHVLRNLPLDAAHLKSLPQGE